MSAFQLTADSLIFLTLFYIGMFLYEHYYVKKYDFDIFMYSFLASVIAAIGILAMNYSIVHGKAGPV